MSIESRFSKIKTWKKLYFLLKRLCKENNIYLYSRFARGFCLPIRGNAYHSFIYIRPTLLKKETCIVLLHELGHLYVKDKFGFYKLPLIVDELNSERKAEIFMKKMFSLTQIKFTKRDKDQING